MASTDPKQVQDGLVKKNKENSSNKLTFDPVTGELILKNSYEQETRPDEVVVDQIYKDGFFINNRVK